MIVASAGGFSLEDERRKSRALIFQGLIGLAGVSPRTMLFRGPVERGNPVVQLIVGGRNRSLGHDLVPGSSPPPHLARGGRRRTGLFAELPGNTLENDALD